MHKLNDLLKELSDCLEVYDERQRQEGTIVRDVEGNEVGRITSSREKMLIAPIRVKKGESDHFWELLTHIYFQQEVDIDA